MDSQNEVKTVLDVGLHYDVPAAVYHADPCPTHSLSSGCARTILEKSIEHAALEHPKLGGKSRESSAVMDLGSLVHALMAGESSFEVGDFDDYKTKAAQAWRDGVRASGKTPVLEKAMHRAHDIADALKNKAADGIDNSPFTEFAKHEVTAIWKEGDAAYCRARYDLLSVNPQTFDVDIWDWKTTSDVSDDAITRTIIDHGYHIQAAFYMRGLAAVRPDFAGRISFIFVFAETEAPHHVRRVCLPESFMTAGRLLAGRAIWKWRDAIAKSEFTVNRSASTFMPTPPSWYMQRLSDMGLEVSK